MNTVYKLEILSKKIVSIITEIDLLKKQNVELQERVNNLEEENKQLKEERAIVADKIESLLDRLP